MSVNYNVTLQRFNGTDSDNLYPTPATHASSHATGGTDAITPASINAVSERFGVELVPRNLIASNSDLNTVSFLIVKKYYCTTENASTLSNCPTQNGFFMDVYSPVSQTVDNETTGINISRFRVITDIQGNMWVQSVNSFSTPNVFTYSEWGRVYTSLTTVPISNGGTGATSAANARTSLGITPSNIGAASVTNGKVTPTEASSTIALVTETPISLANYCGQFLRCTNTSDIVINLNEDTATIPIGSEFEVFSEGTGEVAITAGASYYIYTVDGTPTLGNSVSIQNIYGCAAIKRISETIWLVTGDIG